MTTELPPVTGILETALYVRDLDRSARFYRELFGFAELLNAAPRLIALGVAGRSVLLLFLEGATSEPVDLPGGRIPGHGAAGVQHFAFGIAIDQVEPWLQRLEQHGIPLESRVDWEGGAVSLYFRDPDHHAVELITPGFWPSTDPGRRHVESLELLSSGPTSFVGHPHRRPGMGAISFARHHAKVGQRSAPH